MADTTPFNYALAVVVASSVAGWFSAATWRAWASESRSVQVAAAAATQLSATFLLTAIAASVAGLALLLLGFAILLFFLAVFVVPLFDRGTEGAGSRRRHGGPPQPSELSPGDVVQADIPFEQGADEEGRTHKARPVTVYRVEGEWVEAFYMTSKVEKRGHRPGWVVVHGNWDTDPSALDTSRLLRVHAGQLLYRRGRLAADQFSQVLQMHANRSAIPGPAEPVAKRMQASRPAAAPAQAPPDTVAVVPPTVPVPSAVPPPAAFEQQRGWAEDEFSRMQWFRLSASPVPESMEQTLLAQTVERERRLHEAQRVHGVESREALYAQAELLYVSSALGSARDNADLISPLVEQLRQRPPGLRDSSSLMAMRFLAACEENAKNAARVAEVNRELLAAMAPFMPGDHDFVVSAKDSLARAESELLALEESAAQSAVPPTAEGSWYMGRRAEAAGLASAGKLDEAMAVLHGVVGELGEDVEEELWPITLDAKGLLVGWAAESGDLTGAARAREALLAEAVEKLTPFHPRVTALVLESVRSEAVSGAELDVLLTRLERQLKFTCLVPGECHPVSLECRTLYGQLLSEAGYLDQAMSVLSCVEWDAKNCEGETSRAHCDALLALADHLARTGDTAAGAARERYEECAHLMGDFPRGA